MMRRTISPLACASDTTLVSASSKSAGGFNAQGLPFPPLCAPPGSSPEALAPPFPPPLPCCHARRGMGAPLGAPPRRSVSGPISFCQIWPSSAWDSARYSFDAFDRYSPARILGERGPLPPFTSASNLPPGAPPPRLPVGPRSAPRTRALRACRASDDDDGRDAAALLLLEGRSAAGVWTRARAAAPWRCASAGDDPSVAPSPPPLPLLPPPPPTSPLTRELDCPVELDRALDRSLASRDPGVRERRCFEWPPPLIRFAPPPAPAIAGPPSAMPPASASSMVSLDLRSRRYIWPPPFSSRFRAWPWSCCDGACC